MPKPIGLHLPKSEVTPDPEVEKRTCRTFSAEYKLRILAEAAKCRHGLWSLPAVCKVPRSNS
jgi:hypothetical protein